MMLGFPEWIVYVAMVPPFILTAVIALAQAIRSETDAQGASA
jgi:TRAP-type C4-dicarboxylate transport system permease small subunit